MADNTKICFIACTNDDKYERECQMYLSRLIVPEGMSMDFISVKDASSMCGGYNEAMHATDAKYKVYLHQDTYVINTNFIFDIINIFKDSDIGIIGFKGAPKLANDFVISHSYKYDMSQRTSDNSALFYEVDAVDGAIIAAQYDVPWREDVFDGWDFYDVSVSAEYKKLGYKVVIANQQTDNWVYHDSKPHKLKDFEKYREIAIKEYSDIFGINTEEKKIAFISFKEISSLDVAWAIVKLGYDADIIDSGISIYSISQDDADAFCRLIQKRHADVVISFDFCAALSDGCKKAGVLYASWVYDSPQQALYEDQVANECNYIFSFDRDQVNQIKKYGGKRVFHLPLATNVEKNSRLVIENEDIRRFSCDVSFVGNLYTDNIYEYCSSHVSEETKREYDEIINDIYGVWDGSNRMSNRLSDKAIRELTTIEESAFNEGYKMNLDDFLCARLIARYAANKERIEILQRLAKYKLRFFTSEKDITIPGVKCLPPVKYDTELPKVYNLSKINLNITLHSITSGIPLRVFDIMGVGGFMLTNYQPEVDDLFVVGKEIEVYHSIDELDEKVRFYLSHDRIRKDIAINGYKKVKKELSYENQVKKLISEVIGG